MVLINKIIGLSRRSKQLILMLVDSVLAVFALLSSFALRLEGWIWPQDELFWLVFGSPILIIAVFHSFGLYQAVTRFSGLKSLFFIFLAATLYSTLWGLIGYMIGFEGTPRSVVIINWLGVSMLILGSRVFARWILGIDEINNTFSPNDAKNIAVMIPNENNEEIIIEGGLRLIQNRWHENNPPNVYCIESSKEIVAKIKMQKEDSEILLQEPDDLNKFKDNIKDKNIEVRIKSKQKPKKNIFLVFFELVVFYFIFGAFLLFIEKQTLGNIHNQGWEFYIITFFLFLVFSFPGFIYKIVWK